MKVPLELLGQARSWPTLKRWERRALGQALRELGLSYREIGHIIPVPKGTLSAWCRDIRLSPEQQARLKALNNSQSSRRQAGLTLRNRNLLRVEAIRASARSEASSLLSDTFWVAGVVAYWAEGAKRMNGLQFSNSDPSLVLLFIRWSSRYLDLTADRFRISLNLHDGQAEPALSKYWSTMTGIPLSQFRKTYLKAEGTGHRKNLLYQGTASIRVTRSADLLNRVKGWIDVMAIGPWDVR
jgi:hypothetical protein